MNTQITHHQPSARVLVECHSSKLGRCEFLPGIVENLVSALDRDCRLQVQLDNGGYIDGAAPECVVPFK